MGKEDFSLENFDCHTLLLGCSRVTPYDDSVVKLYGRLAVPSFSSSGFPAFSAELSYRPYTFKLFLAMVQVSALLVFFFLLVAIPKVGQKK